MAKRKSKFASQAALEALVRYGPQISVLTEAQREAERAFRSTVGQARGGAAAVQNAVDTARPGVRDIYERAGLDQARTSQTLIGKDLAGLSGVADSIKGGAALEAAGMSGRLREAQGAALTDLADRRVRASEGAVYATRAAQSKLEDDLTKILQQRKDLAGQKGAFQAATIGELQQAARERALKVRMNNADNSQAERNSIRSSGIDPDTMKPIPGGKLDPKAKNGKRLTATGAPAVSADKHLEFQSQVTEIKNYAAKWKGKMSRAEIVEKLKRGRPQQQVLVDGKGNPVPDGTPGARKVTLTKIPQFKPDIAMTVALDIALDGHLSRKTQRTLQQHYILRELGFKTYGQWRKKHPRPTPQQRKSAYDSAGRNVSALAGLLDLGG